MTPSPSGSATRPAWTARAVDDAGASNGGAATSAAIDPARPGRREPPLARSGRGAAPPASRASSSDARAAAASGLDGTCDGKPSTSPRTWSLTGTPDDGGIEDVADAGRGLVEERAR